MSWLCKCKVNVPTIKNIRYCNESQQATEEGTVLWTVFEACRFRKCKQSSGKNLEIKEYNETEKC